MTRRETFTAATLLCVAAVSLIGASQPTSSPTPLDTGLLLAGVAAFAAAVWIRERALYRQHKSRPYDQENDPS